jgi:hypothetical protein
MVIEFCILRNTFKLLKASFQILVLNARIWLLANASNQKTCVRTKRALRRVLPHDLCTPVTVVRPLTQMFPRLHSNDTMFQIEKKACKSSTQVHLETTSHLKWLQYYVVANQKISHVIEKQSQIDIDSVIRAACRCQILHIVIFPNNTQHQDWIVSHPKQGRV